ncbi:blast:Putative 115 kDa protein in type-1 retrotransposable element R1DM, partial [Drosophila guanche]
YLDAVLLLASRTPVIFGLDANAVSPAWFRKLSEHARGQAKYARGELLSEWITENRAGVLNEASRVFSFDNRNNRHSDIDVTIANEAATMWATYDWKVREWDTSDHNMIHVEVTRDPTDTVESFAPVPSWKLSNARWRLFEEEVTDGGPVATWSDCASVLLRNFFPVAESNAHIAIPSEAPPALRASEVDACVARLKSRRSPGMDGITGAICKAVWRAIPQQMTALYSRCLETGYFPAEWKHPRVVPLLKGPDRDRTDPASYRGICLLPVLGKVLEGIMVNRLKDTIPDGCRWQFGFREGRCVEDAWRHV